MNIDLFSEREFCKAQQALSAFRLLAKRLTFSSPRQSPAVPTSPGKTRMIPE
jgi:hypothetical protein